MKAIVTIENYLCTKLSDNLLFKSFCRVSGTITFGAHTIDDMFM